AIEVAARYATKRKAFGQFIRKYQGVSFKVADAIATLDAARGLVYAAGRAADAGTDARRLVSEAKKVATEAGWLAINHAMQILGGIGYTKVFPVERLMRDMRLGMIWTGTNEIMNLLIQHEYFKEVLKRGIEGRDIAADVPLTEEELAEEIIYE
ncbi:MAG: acyl-CoA dehydrogenase, partial [Deltaproteobacteria bacterium]